MLSLAHYGLFHDENTWTFGSGGTSAERWRDFARSLGGMVTVFLRRRWTCLGDENEQLAEEHVVKVFWGVIFLVCYIGPKLTKALQNGWLGPGFLLGRLIFKGILVSLGRLKVRVQ